jgi:hypothetical protein
MSFRPDFSDPATLEKYSSAFSLSDMEIFVFPELLYPLVLANIMSPLIWAWRDDPWFSEMPRKKSFTWKVNRIKQYIMDHYVFNLDLNTWGLTDKETEMRRFRGFVDMPALRQSNALFGYEGDKYYFSIDIRRHFGLDRYDSEVIPYWKTETVEAMTAFRYRASFTTGAGECVSLSALYAAALFVVGRIPLEQIFLISTPLHSQNFIDHQEGLLTNNRRIVTKKMWFNGTALSTKARRALENEKVTIVSHLSGYIHYVFPKATIDPEAYAHFAGKLHDFTNTGLTVEVFINFLRYQMKLRKCFQYRHQLNGRTCYIALETLFEYEHSTKINFSEGTMQALFAEIDDEEFSMTPLKMRMLVQDVEDFLAAQPHADEAAVKDFFEAMSLKAGCTDSEITVEFINDLRNFLHVTPQLPEPDRQFEREPALPLHPQQTRSEITECIRQQAATSETALLALYVYRKMDAIDWTPFIKAALERNPVSAEGLKDASPEEAYQFLTALPDESIYEGVRLAQPDEVWNFGRGDGVEKALVLANFLRSKDPGIKLELKIERDEASLETDLQPYRFSTSKNLSRHLIL